MICTVFIPISVGFNVKDLIIEQSSIISGGKTLYVGGSGPENYTKIQEAIDDAVDSDTVFVYDDNSPYYENIVVDKSISLFGEDKATTVIDGGNIDNVIFVNANWVNISGFTIQNSHEYKIVAGIKIDSNHNSISDNIITNNNFGILLLNSHSVTISRNKISNNLADGIFIHLGSNYVLSDNIIINNKNSGIQFQHSNYNNISGNYILNHSYFGIILLYSDNNTISNNSILNCLNCGIDLYSSSYNTIIDNKITNTDFGILLHNTSNNKIIDNSISIIQSTCISLKKSFNNIIIDNSIISNNGTGIILSESVGNTVLGNIVSNHFSGISIKDSFENTIERNLISNNSNCGLYLSFWKILDNKSYSKSNRILKNNFIDNEKHANFWGYYCSAKWYQNYWGRPRLLPKFIFGELKICNIYIPWINIDWRPAFRSYDI